MPADVPCGACNACCRTFHQIHLRPGEKRARKRLPREFLSPAPGLPPGYLLLGYTEEGACPVLVGGRCTIYEDRPLVCRTYDCRIYAATDVPPDRADIAAQVRRWRFSYPDAEDRELHEAVLAAARFIREHPECLPSEAARGSRCASPRWRSSRTRGSWPAPPSARAAGRSPTATAATPSPTPTRNSSATVDAPRPPRIPCGQPPAPAGGSRPEGGVMGKELSILAHDTVDQPPPAACS